MTQQKIKITAANKQFGVMAGERLRLNVFGLLKIRSSIESLSVKIRHKRQAAKTLAVIVTDDTALR